MSAADYDRDDVVAALRGLGVRSGDTLFTHAGVAMLGRPAQGLRRESIAELFLSAFREVLGTEGTWVLPAYTYSYTKREAFDPSATPPTKGMGVLPEALWRHPDAHRSLDPIFSVIAFGGRAAELTAGIPQTCFGADSIYARILEADGAMCNIGIGSHAALIHHVEQKLEVEYRYPKEFTGTSIIDGKPRETSIVYHVRALDEPRHHPYFMRLDHDARAEGATRAERVGRGEINLIRARQMERLIAAGLASDPEYLVRGPLAAQDG